MERAEIAPFIARESFAWPGGYEMFAVTDDGGILCYKCCKNEADTIAAAYRGDGWYVIAVDSMANCDGPQICDHCSREIE